MSNQSQRAVVVGSSPLLLLAAGALAKGGMDVEVIEHDQLGGSWTTTEFAGFSAVETACHLLELDPLVYRHLADAGVPMVEMDPAPVVKLGRLATVPYASPFMPLMTLALLPLSATRRLLRSLRVDRPEAVRIRREVIEHLRSRPAQLIERARSARRTSARIQYFDGGAASMLTHLVHEASTAGCRLTLGERVVEVTAAAEGPVHLVLSSGEHRLVDRLVVSSGSRLGRVEVGEHSTVVRGEAREHVHLLLALRPGSAAPMSYVHLPYHRLLHRVTDVTAAAMGVEQTQLLLVNLRCSWSERPPVATVMDLLRRHSLCAGGTVPLEHRWLHFESHDASQELARLAGEDAHGRLLLLRSHGDLVRSIRSTADEWLAPRIMR